MLLLNNTSIQPSSVRPVYHSEAPENLIRLTIVCITHSACSLQRTTVSEYPEA
jgi:hypothetical protein